MKNFSICGVNLDEIKSGRLFKKSDDPIENLQNVIDDQSDEIQDLKDTIEGQNSLIEDLKTQINKISDVLNEISVEDESNKESGLRCERKIEMLLKENDRNFEKFSENDAKFGQELLQQKETMDDAVSDLIRDINKLRSDLSDSRTHSDSVHDEILGKIIFLRRNVEELKEKTWELDSNTRNNLVFYGIKEEGQGNSGQSER